jgi:hypothetical protein
MKEVYRSNGHMDMETLGIETKPILNWTRQHYIYTQNR